MFFFAIGLYLDIYIKVLISNMLMSDSFFCFAKEDVNHTVKPDESNIDEKEV